MLGPHPTLTQRAGAGSTGAEPLFRPARCNVHDDSLKDNRRSTRLSISIPIIISGVDADGNPFSESVRTLIVNKHGGKIMTARHLARGTEVVIENRPLGVVAKASVAWLNEKHREGNLHLVGLQLLEAQDIWGIAFPPDDWRSEIIDEESAAPAPLTAGRSADGPAPRVSSLAGEEITIQLLKEMQESADGHARDFENRVKELVHRLGLELEIDLRERASLAKQHEVGALEEQVKALRESLRAAREEMAKLEAGIQELKSHLPVAAGSPSPAPLHDAQRQLAALANSVVESMNRAAEAGLREYQNLLQEENRESAARQGRDAGPNPPPPNGP